MTKPKYLKMAQILCFLSLLISCKEEPVNTYKTPRRPVPVDMSVPFTIEQHTLSNNQKIDIYIPPEYNENISYPIVYFNDGDNYQNVFDVRTQNYKEPFLMVGLYAGANREDKYVPYKDSYVNSNTATSVAYSASIVNEIIPYVEERYNVDGSRRAIFGMSFGGLHATWMGLNYPEIFSFVGAMSPSYWVDDYAILTDSDLGISSSNRFYFDIGTNTGEWNYYVPFISRLKLAGLRYGNQIFYYEVFGGSHSGVDWALRVHIPLKLFLNEGVPSGSSTTYNIFVECIPSAVTQGLVFQRLNPVVTFENGIKYSLTTEARYEIVSGNGQVTTDGRFEVSANGSMTVRVSYGGWSEEIILTNCF